MLLVTCFETVSQTDNNGQTSCCFKKFSCSWINIYDVTILRHKD